MVNGPEDVTRSWEVVDWRRHEDNVRRLRQRIFTAAQEENLAAVRSLQKLMLRSWSNTLISVRQASQRNAGRKTAGIDGKVALTSRARMELAVQVHRDASSWRPRPGAVFGGDLSPWQARILLAAAVAAAPSNPELLLAQWLDLVEHPVNGGNHG